MFRGLTVEPDDVFVDFGCGLGRAVCVAAQYPFAKVYGVEISASAAACARSNIELLRSKVAGSIEILCASAEEFDCRLGNTFYFFNPFGEKTMAAVLANIKTAWAHSGSPIRILYNNPMHKTLLDGSGWLSEKKVLVRRAFDRPPTLLYKSN
jgi:predicted RNA methylase